MSPNVGNFVHDLVEMAKAMEELPQVQRAFELANQRNDELARTVQDRELAIIDYKAQIEELNSKVRSLEVERDDASFRILESEDLAHKALSFAKQAESAAATVMSLLDPPKPEPIVDHAAEELAKQPFEPEPQPQAVPTATDQSVADPTSNATNGEPKSEQTSVSDANPTSGSENLAATSTELAKGPYFGKRYYDMPTYISMLDWFEGGGSETDYYWRPSTRDIAF